MLTNYLSVLRLTEHLLPRLTNQEAAAIINVTSVVAIAPAQIYDLYLSSPAQALAAMNAG